jgi:DNA-binding transcriptional LysR family regulator
LSVLVAHSACTAKSQVGLITPNDNSAPGALLPEMVVFARVVEHGSFSAAARALGVSSSAVSRSVARLEASIGGQLLHRNTRALSVTDIGERVYAGCAQIARTAQDIRAMSGEQATVPAGLLRVTAPVSLGQCWLVPRLQPLLARWQQLHLSITLTDRVTDLVEENFDLAIRIGNELPPGLVARELCRVSYVLVASPSHLRAQPAPKHPSELVGRPCIVLGYGAFRGELVFRHRSSDEQVSVRTSGPLDVNNGGAVLAAAEVGMGIGVTPDFTAAAALRSGSVLPVLSEWRLEGPYQERPVNALYAPTRHLSRKVRVVIDWLLDGAPPSSRTDTAGRAR